MTSKRGASFVPLFTVTVWWILSVGLCHGNLTVQDVLDRINRTAFEMEKPPPVYSAGDTITLTCSNNLSLNVGEKFEWYQWLKDEAPSLNTSPSVEHYEEKEEDHSVIDVKLKESESFVYVYCVDPQTRNVVRGFKLEQRPWKLMYEHLEQQLTVCDLHDDFITVLSCTDMFIPPTETHQCDWTHNDSDEDETGSLVVLGVKDEEEEGTYKCRCKPEGFHKAQTRSEMTFVVNRATVVRNLANFQFCRHYRKSDHENDVDNRFDTGREPTSNDTSTFSARGDYNHDSHDDDDNLRAVCIGLGVVCAVLVGACVGLILLALKLKKRLQRGKNKSSPAKESAAPGADENGGVQNANHSRLLQSQNDDNPRTENTQ